MSQVLLEMNNIKKSFGAAAVLKDVHFALKKGEVHALVGGNGAGKSTLMKIMTGVYTLDEGEILIEGQVQQIDDPMDAKKAGIAMIFQELSLVQTMTVAENIFLGEELKKGIFRDVEAMNRRAREVLEELGLDVDPTTPVNQLSVGMSQMIEIAKAISKNARILVLDEPTASLSTSETAHLFKIIRELKEKGVSMVYISHRMNEILDIADAITILRDGELIVSDAIENMDLEKIIFYMVGGKSSQKKFEWVERAYDAEGEDLLRLEHLKVDEKIKDISFSVKKGEILGLAGLMGSGRTEILETLFAIRTKKGGTVWLDGRKVDCRHPWEAVQAGFALVPEDRRKQGLVLEHSVRDNAILPIVQQVVKGKTPTIDDKAINEIVNRDVEKFNIVTSSINKRIGLLSGGNQQKVVISKWLNTNPKIMMLDEPTAGVDIGAKSEIIHIIRKFADQGNGVILVSSEFTEMLAVCDRIITLFDGRITGVIPRKDIKEEEELEHAVQESGE
ncbi:sugar ABC transporter ATP-binding protein [Anaerotalea alkaliphila]|uniref:Sugar ABC transporter ATP-binding protein n=1 Tax=Anaerotalea alkaliphila TaxID=2662126 RepID=A0A7X5HUP6_9FIRM|nr:sugar ABC transporter ATP-binding protein [Anaerotalea alkaliphila]NDL67026.1 sugar ABC transporter ATP-binding protein [Anaerotalea alkaliphila]